ncbi:MAG: YdeI/OmpD-associated family protein [Deltaproteobacteria bacterium]|nr:YdeI/OmpD-associated family protein [Deltaproteobacteria bacterium]
MHRDPKVDAFLARAKAWGPELSALRELALASGLTECLKWGQPCYTREDANVLILGPFKEYCTLAFFKGALLKDPERLLRQPGKVQSGRQLRVTSLAEIKRLAPTMRAYIKEAIAVEAAGLSVAPKETADFEVPPELTQRFAADAALKQAFHALTPGRQRGWLHHFGSAKKPETRAARIEKARAKILKGEGPLG